MPSFESEEYFGSREEPEGEEGIDHSGTTNAQSLQNVTNSPSIALRNTIPNSSSRDNLLSSTVKVPTWVMSESVLDVAFNDRAEEQIQQLQLNKVNLEE